MTHNAETQFFVDGTVASQGIVNMSQTGSRDPLNDEIDNRFIGTGGAQYRVNATTRVRPSPDTVSFEFNISSSHPQLSLVSMIAPSPDWFVSDRVRSNISCTFCIHNSQREIFIYSHRSYSIATSIYC